MKNPMMKTNQSPLVRRLLIAILPVVALSSHTIDAQAQQPTALVAQVAITRNSDQTAQVVSSSEQRIDLGTGGAVAATIQLSPGNGSVRFRTPEGGLVNGQRELVVDTNQQGRQITLTFDPQDITGVCFIEVSDSERVETAVQFWAGPRPASGQPGPNLPME